MDIVPGGGGKVPSEAELLHDVSLLGRHCVLYSLNKDGGGCGLAAPGQRAATSRPSTRIWAAEVSARVCMRKILGSEAVPEVMKKWVAIIFHSARDATTRRVKMENRR